MTVLRSGDAAQTRRRPRLDIGRWFAAAVFALTFAIIFAPVLYLLYGSFQSDSPAAPSSHFTLANWAQVYGTSEYFSAFLNTVILGATVAAFSVALGTVFAWIVARTNAPLRERLAPLLVVPLMISTLVTTLSWIALAAPNAGFINAATRALLGIRTVFDIYSFSGIVLIMVLHYASFAFIPIYAALRSMDASLEEASYMLGASAARTALKMTAPLIWPTLAATYLLIFILVAENFAVPTILGHSIGFETLMSIIYFDMAREPSAPTLAATAGTMLLSIAVIGTLWQRRIIRQASRYVLIGGKGGRHKVTDLGRLRYVATAVLVAYLLLAVVIPYCALLAGSGMKFVTPHISTKLFTLNNYRQMFSFGVSRPIANSLGLATIGAAAATLFYVYLAFLIKTSRSVVGKAMDFAVILPTVTPAIAFGVGFVWAYVSLPIYGTIWLLFLGYLTRFMGQGVRQARAAFVQISDDLADAARIAGASPLRTFWDIMLPLLRPSLISIWTIMFLFFFMEVSLTIVLYTPKTVTLPILLWTRMTGGLVTIAYAIAVLQATIAFVFLIIANRWFGTLRSSLTRG
jgi:iron(III) transport system permease protein